MLNRRFSPVSLDNGLLFWLKLVKHYQGSSQNVFLGNCFVLMKLERIVDLQNRNSIKVDLFDIRL